MRWVRVLVAVLLGATVLAITPTAAGAQGDGLTSSSTWTYRVDAEQGLVDVSIEAVYTNVKPNRSTSRGVTQYYFTGSVLVVPTDVENLSITSSSGGDLDWEVIEEESDDLFQVIEVGFARNIFYRQTTTVNASFQLVDNGPRRTSPVRINDAYAGFDVFAIDVSGEASVRVELPARFRVDDQFGNQMRESVADGIRVLEADEIDTFDFWTYLSASDLDRAVTEEVSVEGVDVTLRSWPDDAEWADFARDGLERGLPVITDMLGDWPLDPELDLVESYAPVHQGYAGWFDLERVTIEVGDELDEHLLFHELSHAWVHNELFEERWIYEGLAELFAAETVARLEDPADPEREDAPRVSSTDANATQLNRWSNFSGLERDSWAYPASWKVMDEIAEQTGIEGLVAVIEAATANDIAYPGDGEAETIRQEVDGWERFLDLAEGVGGADDLQDVFDTWVVVNRTRLDERAEARAAYDELVTAGDGWAAPISLRTTMAAWEFDEALDQIDGAMSLLEQRDTLRAEADALDLALPERLEPAYEAIGTDATVGLAEPDDTTSESSIGRVLGDVDDARADAGEEDAEQRAELIAADAAALDADMDALSTTIAELAEAREGIDGAEGFLVDLGLYGTDLEADYAAAVDAFGDDDLDGATTAADAIDETVAEAADLGRTRLLTAVAAVVGLLVLLLGIIWWRRRRRRAAEPTTITPEPTEGDELAGPALPVPETPAEEPVAPLVGAAIGDLPIPEPDHIDRVAVPATLFDALGDEHDEIEPPDTLESATATPGPESTEVGEPPTP